MLDEVRIVLGKYDISKWMSIYEVKDELERLQVDFSREEPISWQQVEKELDRSGIDYITVKAEMEESSSISPQ